MTLKKKLQQAATKAAQQAAMRERGRCLWLLDEMVVQTEAAFAKTVLVERDRQIAQVKLEIAKSLAHRLKQQIVIGRAPPMEGGHGAQATKFIEDHIECENCFDAGTMYHEGQRLCQGCYNAKRFDEDSHSN